MGQAIEMSLNDSGITSNLMAKGVLPAEAGKVYRAEIQFKLYAASASLGFANIVQLLDENFVSLYVGTYGTSSKAASTSQVYTLSLMFSSVASAGVTAVANIAAAKYIRFGLRRTTSGTSGVATVRIGKILFEEVSDVVSLQASVTALQSASVNTNGALANLETNVNASIGDLTAGVNANATAAATLAGYAAASQVFRAVAGSAGASVELVAADSPTGPASLAKISADNFLVTAKSMLITGGVGAALNLDPNLQDASAWSAGGTPTIVTITDGVSGDKALRGAAGVNKTYSCLSFAISPLKKYRLRGSYRKSADADGTSLLRLYWFTGAGVYISYSDVPVPAATTSFVEVSLGGITPPATARFARINVQPNISNTVGYHEWQGLFCEEQIESTLLVDGAVRARHMSSETLITQSAQIGNGVVVSANIGDAQITYAKIADAQITAAKILDLQVTNAKLASAAVTTAKIGDLQVDTLKIAGNAVTVFRGARNTAVANSTVNAWTTVAWVGFTPTDGANSLLVMVGAGMTMTSGSSGGGITAKGNVRLLWRGNVVREFTNVMTLVAGGNTILSPLAMTEILSAGWGYGELIFQISKGSTAGNFTVDASLIAGEFKR